MYAPYESRLALEWLANAANRIHHDEPRAENLAEWANEHITELKAGLADYGCAIDSAELAEAASECARVLEGQGSGWRSRMRSSRTQQEPQASGVCNERAWRKFRTALHRASDTTQTINPDATTLRLRRLAQTTGLNDGDLQIVEILLRYQTQPMLESLLDDTFDGLGRSTSLKNASFANLLGMSANSMRSRCAPNAPLVRFGLLEVDEDGNLELASRLSRLVFAPNEATDPLPILLGAPAQAELEWQDFDHLKQQRADVEDLLRAALRERTKGVNVLLHGPSGTGKTQFARALAARMGVALFNAGEVNERGDEILRKWRGRRSERVERIADLWLVQNLLRRETGALLLFDDMDDLLIRGSSLMPSFRSDRVPSRLLLKRLLEENPTPTLWIAHDVHRIETAYLWRMMFAIQVRQPPPEDRQGIWTRQLKGSGIEASTEDAIGLSQVFNITPGGTARAVAAAALMRNGKPGAVSRCAQNQAQLLATAGA